MFKNLYRVLMSLTAILAVGLGGSFAANAQEPEMDPWDPEAYEEDRIEVEVDEEEEEPELIPPVVPVPPEEIARPTSINPLMGGDMGRLAVDLGMHLSETENDLTFFLLTPVLQARLPVGNLGIEGAVLELGADLGLLMVNPIDDPADQLQNAVGIGNPFLSVHYVQALEQMNYRIGAGVAVPLATIDGDRGASRAFGYMNAIGNRVGFDRYLWEPDRLGLVIPARIEGVTQRVVLGADAAVGTLIWTGPGTQDTTYFGQLAGEVGYQVSPTTTVGLRLLGHWLPDIDLDDPSFAFGLEPGFRTQIGDGGFLGVRLTIPVDEPYGFAFERGGNWALSVTFGTNM